MAIPGPRLGQRSFQYVFDSSVLTWTVMAQPAVSNSTQVAISSLAGVVRVAPSDTNWASSAGFHFTAGELQVVQSAPVAGSTTVTVAALPANSSQVEVRALPANSSNVVVTAMPAGSTSVTISLVDLTAASPTNATVSTTSGQAVASNANRKGLVLVNTSTAFIALGFGATAVVKSGIVLNPNGGTFEMGRFTFDIQAINAVASVGTTNVLAIQEWS